jgi:hypothetical protein
MSEDPIHSEFTNEEGQSTEHFGLDSSITVTPKRFHKPKANSEIKAISLRNAPQRTDLQRLHKATLNGA